MTTTTQKQTPPINIPTVIAIGALVMSLNVAIHEGIHALACLAVGADLSVYTALSVECSGGTTAGSKFVSLSAPLANLIIGAAVYWLLRRSTGASDEVWYTGWLFMLVNWLAGAGYLLFSGVAGVGDIAAVLEGWQPAWLWRGLTLLGGAVLYLGVIAVALRLFGTRVGGTDDERISRAQKLAVWSYVGVVIPVVLASLFHPAGFTGLPAVAGMAAAVLGQSPLLWMMQWFRAKSFPKRNGVPLQIRPNGAIPAAAIIVAFLYGVGWGRGIFF